MSVYVYSGETRTPLYDVNGTILVNAYDVAGNIVYNLYDHPLKVMTYNVGGWYIGSGRNVPAAEKEAYYKLHTETIQENDPDILMIQEYLDAFSDDGTSALTMLQNLFPYVHTVTSGIYFGRAICSKFPITNYVQQTYTKEPSRYYDYCTVAVGTMPLTCVVTHPGLTQVNRDAEIAELVPFLETLDAFICCGDFNTAIKPTEDETSDHYIYNVKPFIDAGFNSANWSEAGFLVTYNNGVDGTGTSSCIDGIYTSSNLVIGSVKVDTRKLTDGIVAVVDHMPLIAEITLPSE